MSCDIVLVGVGGQGVLTIADLLIRAAFEAGVAATYCPTKGMAQRGGFVKAEVRLGRDDVGSRIGEGQADLVVSMERSEALKGLPFLRPSGTFLLYDHVWAPTGVMLGEDAYPERAEVAKAIKTVSEELIVLDSGKLPSVDGNTVRPNIYILGAMIGRTALGEILSTEVVGSTISTRWTQVADANLKAFRAGLGSGNGA
ncbi:2-oxoacid:acceptor oxidoreductase family protein [Candidatus Bipolaricaulota bacterium]